jgi:hypothetical protein
MNDTARQWQNKLSSLFQIIRNTPDTIFADDQAIIAKTEDNLERGTTYILNYFVKNRFKMSTVKKVMGSETQSVRLCGKSLSCRTVPPSAEEMLQNTPVQRLKGGNPTTGVPSGRLSNPP